MIIGIVGMSGSGKDTAAKYIRERYGIDMLVSYTTRPKREYETNGKEHWFISKQEMDQLKREEEMIAYTINPMTGIEYCTTVSQMEGRDVIYIINPEGIRWMKENRPELEVVSIYISVPVGELRQRLKDRGDQKEVFEKRLESEIAEFTAFADAEEYDILIRNESREQMYRAIDAAMLQLKKTA